MSVKATRIIISLILAAAFIVFMFFLTSGFFSTASEKVLPGVEVMDVKLGGLNRAEGTDRLLELEKNLRGTRVTLRFEDRSWQLLLNETGFELNEEAIMDAALSGFKVISKESLPQKVWKECVNCPKFPNCEEIAMIYSPMTTTG
jgi:hypothetical protein